MTNFRSLALIPAVLSIAAAVPAVALAAPAPAPAPAPSHAPAPGHDTDAQAARQTPATVTVTATVAPGQCKPVEGGPSSVEVTDSAGASPDSRAQQVAVTTTPAPSKAETRQVRTEQNPQQNPDKSPDAAKGTPSSRFDPYTCAPVPASTTTSSAPQTTDADSPSDHAPAQTIEPVPTFTTTLAPYPGGTGGLGTAGGSEEGQSDSDPLSAPTTTPTISAPAE